MNAAWQPERRGASPRARRDEGHARLPRDGAGPPGSRRTAPLAVLDRTQFPLSSSTITWTLFVRPAGAGARYPS